MADEATPSEGGAAEKQEAPANENQEATAQEEQAAEAQEPTSLLSDDKSKEGEGASAESSSREGEAPKVEPVEYTEEFELPEGVEMDSDLMDAFKGAAGGLGLPQDQAQKLVSVYAEHAAAVQQDQQKQLNDLVQKQTAEVQSWENSEQTLAMAKKGLAVFSEDAQKVFTENAILGSHPELIKGLAEVGKILSEDTFESGETAGAAPRSAADRIYGGK